MKTVPLKRRASVIAGQAPLGATVHELGGPDEGNALLFIQGNAEFGAEHPSPRLVAEQPPKVAPRGAVLLSVRAPVGAMNIADRPLGIGRGVAAIVPTPQLDPRFLWWVLHSLREELASRQVGSTYGAVDARAVSTLPIPDIAIQTQRRIGHFLDRECERIGAIEALLADHRTAGIELERRVIDDVFAGVPLTRLGWRASIQTGLTLGGKYADEELVEYPYLRVANVQADAITTVDVATVHVPARIARRTTLRRGDVLMTEGGDIDKLGRGAVWDGTIPDCLHQNHVFAVRCGGRLLPEFLAVWTRSSVARSYFERTASRITNIASTNLTKLVRLPVPDLPVADQRAKLRAFYREHHRITELRDQTMQLATGLAEYRDALITEAVTGKLNVRQLSGHQLDESVRAVAERMQPEILPA